MPGIDGFVIIDRNGRLKKPARSAPSIFSTAGKARMRATNDGDSVVPITIDLTREPVFIRSRVL